MNATLTCLGSSSSGNGYILSSGNDKLIIECGVPAKDCLDKLNYNLDGVSGCIVTHGHSDHSAYIKQYQNYGLKVFSNVGVASGFDGVVELEPMTKYHFGGFTVIPLRVPHGDCPNYAYLIVMPDGHKLLFATDLDSFPYEIPGLNSIAIECNYSDDVRFEAMLNGAELRSQNRNHLSLNKCVEVIRRLKSPSLSSVVLLHLSQGLSDAEGFKERIFDECGIRAEVADKGTVHILNKDDF